MSEKVKAVVITEHGVRGQITLRENGTYEVDSVEKSDGTSLREIGRLIAELPGTDEGGGTANYARLDLR